jgi:hypothetical protein
MKRLSLAIGLLLISFVVSVSAAEFATVSPPEIERTPAAGETFEVPVSITVNPQCVRPFLVDVVASKGDALVSNLTGTVINNCGGDTSSFDIAITGTGSAQEFDLQFVDAEFGGVLAAIPVTLNATSAAVEPLLGVLVWRRAILFQVASSGCTTKNDFTVDVLESNPLQLRLVRLEQDPCDAVVPLGTLIRFSYRELGIARGDTFRVVNPLAAFQVP